MKKKILTTLSVVLILGMAALGILAYLSDTDSDVNVMTLGNVKIDQHEYQRADGVAHNAGEAGAGNGVKEGALVDFVQGQGLYPAVPKGEGAYTAEATDLFYWGDYVYSGTAGNGLWNDAKLANVMDKMIFVENIGKSDCYCRTLIAFECPEGMEYSEGPDKEFMMNTNGSETAYKWENLGYFTIDGARYLVMEATYLKVLEHGNTSHPSLLQVVMTHNATNEDMGLLGNEYKIIAVSQAVQTEGFADAKTALETAFPKGDNYVNVAGWFSGLQAVTKVDSADKMASAVTYSGVIEVNKNLSDYEYTINEGIETEINLNDYTMEGTISNKGDISVNDGSMESVGTQVLYNEGNAEIKDVVMGMTKSTGYIANSRTKDSVTVYENVTVTSSGGGINVWEGEAVFKSGTITLNSTSTSPRHMFYAANGAKLTIEDGEFIFNPTNLTRKGSYLCAQAGATIIVKDGIFHKPSTRTEPIQALDGSSVIIYGGTFQFDPSGFIADGYKATKSTDGWWTVSAK